jgi:phage tail sheath protein FI
MPEFLRPGVFIIETSFRGKPIEGVATSTAGFVGRAQTGPVGKPSLVTSFTQFVREFGSPYPSPESLGEFLGHGVKSFFDNGGLRAYIVRALGAGAKNAAQTLVRGNVLRLPSTGTVRGPTDALPLTSLRNVHDGAAVEIFVRPSVTSAFPGTAKYSFTVSKYNAATRTITLSGQLPNGAVLDPANTFVVVGAAPGGIGPSFTALDEGLSGNDLAVGFRAADLPLLRLQTRKLVRATPVVATGAGPAQNTDTVTLAADAIKQLRVGDLIRLDNGTAVDERRITAIDPATVTYDNIAGATLGVDTTIALKKRDALTLNPPAVLFTLKAGTIVFGATSAPLPHDLASLLKVNDELEAKNGATTLALKIDGVTPAATVKLASNVAHDHSGGTTITLLNPAPPTAGTFGRLVVADASALNAPLRVRADDHTKSFPEPIVVTDGVHSDKASVVLVDAATNTVLYDNGGGTFAWPTLTVDGWVSLESLQVAASGDTLAVASTASLYGGAAVNIDDGHQPRAAVVKSVDSGARTVTLTAPLTIAGPGFIDVDPDPTKRTASVQVLESDLLVYQAGAVVETFAGVAWNPDPKAESFKKYYLNRVNDPRSGSAFVKAALPGGSTDDGTRDNAPSTADGFPARLQDGDDGAPPTNIDLIGQDDGPGHRTGIQALAERDDIAIVAVPGVTDVAVQEALITQCELLKYRFAVLDGAPHNSDVAAIQAHRNNYDSKYAAYYQPWLQTLDLTTGNALLVPPSGAVIGIYARSDNERGVHKAPANEVVRNVFDLEYTFGNGEQEVLNPVGVNLIREFTGRGIRVWGARTLSSDQEWKYVNVRRLFIFLEHSIDNGTQWVVFEPNNEELWARVKSTIEAFLFGIWKTGALMGTKPEEAYFVKVDRTTMTQDDIDNGRLVVLIGVAPTMPAEFVIFHIGQFTASSPTS